MKSLNFIFDSLNLYLFDNDSFKHIANRTSLKTTYFALFLFSFLVMFFLSINSYFIYDSSFGEFFLLVILGSILYFISVFVLLAIVSGFYHLFYKLFKSNAKFKKMFQMMISINIVFVILSLIINLIYYIVYSNPNISFHKTFMYILGFFDSALIIWYLIINIIYLGKIERVNTFKSVFAFLIPIIIFGIMFGFLY